MVAKIEGEKSMVVIDKVRKEVYSICTLRKELKVKDVRLLAKSAKVHEDVEVGKFSMGESDCWWKDMTARFVPRCETCPVALDFLTVDRTQEFVTQDPR
jgi:hypothetical protein